jgi:hypothetical protein
VRLTEQLMPWDHHPLAPKPFMVERETWVTDCDGGASYEGVPLGRFDTLEQALEIGRGTSGPVIVYLMRLGPRGGQHGTSVAKIWDGVVRWVEEREKRTAA